MPYFGRRTIYLWGMTTMTLTLFTIGFLNIGRNGPLADTLNIGQAALTLWWTFTFQLSVGQLGWALPAEMGSTRLRQKTICLARNAYYLASVIARTLEPYFLNPLQWNLRGYTGFVWGGTALVCLIWAFFRLPETKGRTFNEIDVLFAKKVGARKFASYNIQFEEVEEVIAENKLE